MKIFVQTKAVLFAFMFLIFASSAMAWSKDEDCKPDPYHPDCAWYRTKYHIPPKPPAVTPAPATSWSNNYTAKQDVTIAPVVSSASELTQKGTLNQSGSQVGGAVTLNTTDASSVKTTILPSLMAQTPPSTSQIGNIIKTTTACGPMMKIISTRTEGKFFGITSDSSVDLGRDDKLVDAEIPYVEKMGVDGRIQVFGHQAEMVSTVLNVSGGRSIGFGGFSSSGGGAQGSGGTSGSMTEMVTNVIMLRSCEAYGYKTEKVVMPDVSSLAAAVAAQIAMKTELSAPTYEKKYVPCPKDGCKAPKDGYYKMVPIGTISTTSEVGVKANSAVKKP